jgi:hypothetical protein
MITKPTESGIIYEMEDFSYAINKGVVASVTYSGGENGELEFEYAQIESHLNPTLTEDEIRRANKELECGREEEYVRILKAFYAEGEIEFIHPNYEI